MKLSIIWVSYNIPLGFVYLLIRRLYCHIRSHTFIFFNFYFYFILLYNTVLVLHDMNTLTWIHHGCTWDPNPEPPSHLPPHIISLDHPRTPAPSILYPVLNINWWFVSYMIVYMFQCHSPKSSYPLPLPLSPKFRSKHLCLFCCLAYRVREAHFSLLLAVNGAKPHWCCVLVEIQPLIFCSVLQILVNGLDSVLETTWENMQCSVLIWQMRNLRPRRWFGQV